MSTTRQTIEDYFTALGSGGDGAAFLAPDLAFTSRVANVKETHGRAQYLESTARFFSMVTGVEPLRIIVEGERAATLSTYTLSAPGRGTFRSDVAEFFTLHEGVIVELNICFDTAPYPTPAPGQ